MSEVILIAGMAAVTFAVRYPVLALLGKIELPTLATRALRYVPPAVLAAISLSAVLYPDGARLHLGFDNAYLGAGTIAALVSWRTRSLLITIVAGMAAFFLWRWLLGG
jgi:branched-subunit amino acid transport protein